MKFKKIISVVLTLAIGATTLAGCGGSSNGGDSAGSTNTTDTASSEAPAETPAETQTTTDETVNLKWALWDSEATVYYKPLVEAYTAKNPNVNIEFVDLGSADYSTMLSTQLSGGSDLDVLTIKDMPGYYNLIKQNYLEPLNSLNVDKSLYSGMIEQLESDGNIYTLPFRSDFWLVYYNKDLFDAAGIDYPTNDMTFAEYDEIARKVTNGQGADKVYGNHYHTWRSAVQLFGIIDGKNSIIGGEYDFLRPYYEQVLKSQEDGISQDYATLKTSSTHYSGVFYKEQIAMMHMGSWFIATQIQKVKDGESLADNWGLVKYPHTEGVEPGTTIATFTGLSVNPKSQNKDVALDFVKFVTGEEGAEVIVNTGNIPAVKTDNVINTIVSMDGFPQDEASREALITAETYLEIPLADKISDIEVALNEAHDNIMTKNSTIDEGIAEMNERVQEILAR